MYFDRFFGYSRRIEREPAPAFSYPPYFYHEGVETVTWVDGVEVSPGERSKEEDHLYLRADGPTGDWSYATEDEFDLSDVDNIYIDWENIGSTSGQNRSSLNIGGEVDSNEQTFEEQFYRTEDFERRIDSVYVSDLSGNYRIRVHVRGGDSFGAIPGELKVYRVWVD